MLRQRGRNVAQDEEAEGIHAPQHDRIDPGIEPQLDLRHKVGHDGDDLTPGAGISHHLPETLESQIAVGILQIPQSLCKYWHPPPEIDRLDPAVPVELWHPRPVPSLLEEAGEESPVAEAPEIRVLGIPAGRGRGPPGRRGGRAVRGRCPAAPGDWAETPAGAPRGPGARAAMGRGGDAKAHDSGAKDGQGILGRSIRADGGGGLHWRHLGEQDLAEAEGSGHGLGCSRSAAVTDGARGGHPAICKGFAERQGSRSFQPRSRKDVLFGHGSAAGGGRAPTTGPAEGSVHSVGRLHANRRPSDHGGDHHGVGEGAGPPQAGGCPSKAASRLQILAGVRPRRLSGDGRKGERIRHGALYLVASGRKDLARTNFDELVLENMGFGILLEGRLLETEGWRGRHSAGNPKCAT